MQFTFLTVFYEASHVLYQENTFLISFNDSRAHPICPLVRSPVSRQGFNESWPHPSLKARRWRITIDLSSDRYDANFKYFCRLLARTPPKSLEISVVPVWNLDMWPEQKVRERLKSLRKLRSIDKFTLSDAPVDELPVNTNVSLATLASGVQGQPSVHLFSQVKGWNVLAGGLKHLVERNSPVELLPEMYNCLVHYFASFERFELFRSLLEQEHRCDPDTHLGLIGRIKKGSNPFPPGHLPTLGSALSNAYMAAIKDEDLEFKTQRANILNQLEPQYRRIVAASTRMAAFVKEQKLQNGIFDIVDPAYIHADDITDKHEECVDLLEEYADALKARDVMVEVQKIVGWPQEYLESHYRSLPAESAIRELELILDCTEHYSFRGLFKRALDDLDSQYLIIRKARMALYDCDRSNEPGCTIGLKEDLAFQ